MKVTVVTQSGSTYEFTQQEGRTFCKNRLMSGEVIAIKNGPVEVGKCIYLTIRTDNKSGSSKHEDKLITTPLVKEMVVHL